MITLGLALLESEQEERELKRDLCRCKPLPESPQQQKQHPQIQPEMDVRRERL
jgi:hypothetical protein